MRQGFLNCRPCRRRLESRALGHEPDGARVEVAVGFPRRGIGVVNRSGRVERGRSCAWCLWDRQPRRLAQRARWYQLVSEKDSRELTWREKAIHDLEAPDAHISLAHYFLTLKSSRQRSLSRLSVPTRALRRVIFVSRLSGAVGVLP